MVKNLKLLREKKGISQAALALAIGVSQQSINKYENKQTEPDITTLSKLAEYFETSIDYLVGNSEIDHKIKDYKFTNEEINVMESYRELDEKQKKAIVGTIKAFNKK